MNYYPLFGVRSWNNCVRCMSFYILMTPTFAITHDLGLWFFKVQFQNSCILRIVMWLMWNKNNANQLDNGLTVWSCHLTTPMTWTRSFKVKVWNSLIWGMGGLTDMERRGCESITHDHGSDLWVTMEGWVDVPDSDWVTSDVGVLSTYLILCMLHGSANWYGRCRINSNWPSLKHIEDETKFADDIFWCTFLNENCILIQNSMIYLLKGLINHKPTLV